MTRERTHRRRRGRACPRTVWRTPRRTQRRTRGPRCARGARDRGCVTAAPRLPRRRTEPGVHMPRVLGAPPHTAHGPGSRLDCRTQAAPSRAGFGGGWVVGARAQEKLAPHGLRGSTCRTSRPPGGGGRTCRTATGGTCRPHACLPPGKRTCRSCWPQGGSGKLVTFVLHHPRARDARERKIEFFRILPAVSVVLYRGSPIDHFQKTGKILNFSIS